MACRQMAEPEAAARQLPSVDELLSTERLIEARAGLGHALVVHAARETLSQARSALLTGEEQVAPELAELAGRAAERAWAVVRPSQRRVINATGVVVHTNLGRAPLCESAVAAMRDVADSASSIELDLSTGRRGDRHDHLQG
ncbi:MAG: L-seryl-tRNA(Sec) selenium transferase, partial [Chloroflexota bacterium]